MEIKILAKRRLVEDGDFRYGNIESAYGVNTQYFTKNGEPFIPIAGEFHFSRYPHAEWRRELLKMRDAGITVVSTYVFWNYHEENKGEFDFSGDKDIAGFLEICREIGMPCILRIGPWCHGEVIRGGFPKRIRRLPRKRCDDPRYLREVEDFFRGLYAQVEPFCDGETVFGIQLENEYTGKTDHIRTLRRIAERIGFRTPFFTMTAWPSNEPDPEFLPMVGGYPDAPWSTGKRALTPHNRFAIMESRTEAVIGEDLIRSQAVKEGAFDHVAYACCETGPGNQVTQHRRPLISEQDGYGVCFAKFASGSNLLGYYMFHGGRNPNDRLMQENRLTGYPNNYPIIDYDFQSPLSRFGECRAHGDLLRLMHLFVNTFDAELALKQPFFPKWRQQGMQDISFPKCSVRMDDNLSGYFFVSTYEKGLKYHDFKDVQVTVEQNGQSVSLPSIDINAGAMFFYPFRWEACGVLFDYVLAQPVAKIRTERGMTCYFKECPGISPCLSVAGECIPLPLDRVGYTAGQPGGEVELIVLSEQRAREFHVVQGKPVFAKGTVYGDATKAVCETTGGYLEARDERREAAPVSVAQRITLRQVDRTALPYGYFLYSTGKRAYYLLKIDPSLLSEHFDIRLDFRFTGLNLQVFSGKKLINDFFNIDGTFTMYLREYRQLLQQDPELIIKAVPAVKHGAGHVYMEKEQPFHVVSLVLQQALALQVLELEI